MFMPNQARIALFAAIFLGTPYIVSFSGQAFTLVSMGANVSDFAGLLSRFLVFLALPVMLAIWYRTGGAIAPSQKLRWCAAGTAIVLGAFLALGVFTSVLRLFVRSIAEATPVAPGRSLWLIPRFIADAALVLLSVALSRDRGDAAPHRTSGFALLRNVALAATLAAVVAFILNAVQLVESARVLMAQEHGGLLVTQAGRVESMSRPAWPQIALGFLGGCLPPLARFMIPFVVYKTLSGGLRRENPGAHPGSLQQA